MPDDIMEQIEGPKIEGPKKVKELAEQWDKFINDVQNLKTDNVSSKNIKDIFYTCFKDYIEGKNLSKFKKFKSKLGIIPSYTNNVLNAMYQSLGKCSEYMDHGSYLKKFDISSYKKIKTIREAAINNQKIQEKIKEAQGIIKNKLEYGEIKKKIGEAVSNIIKNMKNVKSYYDLYTNLCGEFKKIKCIDDTTKEKLLNKFSWFFNICGLFNSDNVRNIFRNMYFEIVTFIPQYSELKKAAMKQADVIAEKEDGNLSCLASEFNEELKNSSELINYSYITSLFKKMFGIYISHAKLTGIDKSIEYMYEEIEYFNDYTVTTKNNKEYVKIISECRENLDGYEKFYKEFGKCIDLIKEKLNGSLSKPDKK